MIPIYVSSIGYELGERVSLAALPQSADETQLTDLRGSGMEHYRESTDSVGTLSMRSVETTLAAWTGDVQTIDCIIFCSMSLPELDDESLANLCTTANLPKIPVVGISLNGCAHLAPALRFARGLIASEGLRNILVITADKCMTPERRVADMNFAVLSDGAASCIVSSSLESAEFRVDGIGQASNNRLRGIDYSQSQRRTMGMISVGVRESARLALAEACMPEGSASCAIMSNVRNDACQMFAKQCKLSPMSVYSESLSDVGHCFSSDPLINLAKSGDWRRAKATDNDEKRFLVFGLGPFAWGALLFMPV